MRKKEHWQYKEAKDSARMLIEELFYTHKLHSLIDYAHNETIDALGMWEGFNKFHPIDMEIELYSASLISICDMLLHLRLDYFPERRVNIREKASRIAYEIFVNMDMVQQRKSGALKRLAAIYEEEFFPKDSAKRTSIDAPSVSIRSTK